MQRRLIQATLAATVLALAGCGGGGGDSGSTTSFNAAAAYSNVFTSNRTWTLTGTDNFGVNYQFTQTFRPASAGTFPVTGVPANRRVIEASVLANGVNVGNTTSTLYLDPTTGAPIGIQSVESSDGSVSCGRYTSSATPPASAMMGDVGLLATGISLDGCSGSAVPDGSTATVRWLLTNESGVNYFCTNTATVDSGITASEEQCFEVGTDGSIGSRARLTLTANIPGVGDLRLVARGV